jgi:hypothetical protein
MFRCSDYTVMVMVMVTTPKHVGAVLMSILM